MGKIVLLALSDGFEDIEVITPLDVARRLGIQVLVCSVSEAKTLRGIYGSMLTSDIEIDRATAIYDGIILPGGLKNAQTLSQNSTLKSLILEHNRAGKMIAAICASPCLVLAESCQILTGRNACGDRSFHSRLDAQGVSVESVPVCVDSNIITAAGPAAALDFGLTIGRYLIGDEAVRELAEKWGYTAYSLI